MPPDALNSEKPKIIYILPFYDEKTDTHYYYNYELIRAAALDIDIFTVIEKGTGTVNLGTPFQVQKRTSAIGRFIELNFILRKLRKQGYRNIYVHYSFIGAFAGWFSGGCVFYWNCGMPWLFKRKFFEELLFRFILRHATLVTGSEILANEYAKHYKIQRWRIMSNWVDAERFLPKEEKEATKSWFGIKGGTKLILFVHHLSERKGADLISPIASSLQDLDAVFLSLATGRIASALSSKPMIRERRLRLSALCQIAIWLLIIKPRIFF